MQPNKTIPLTVHLPETEEALAQLARQKSALHAELALTRIRSLPCPARQKARLARLTAAALSPAQPPSCGD